MRCQPVQISLVSKTLATSCRPLSRAVENVVRGRPRQPTTAADLIYWSMASCAGVSRGMRTTYPNRLHRVLMADKLSWMDTHIFGRGRCSRFAEGV